MGVSWLAPLPPITPPSHRHPCLRSRSCGPGPEKRCMSPWQPITMQQGLQGYGPGCADVRAQGASKPARWHSAKQSRPARGRPWGPAGRIAPPLARRKREPGVGWRSGGGAHRSPSRGCGPPPHYQHQGPSTSGKSWLSTEEGREDRLQPRRVRADPKEDRERPRGSSIHSTAHAGSEATEGWGEGFSAGLPLLPRCPFSSGAAVPFLHTTSPISQNISIHLERSSSLKAPIPQP